MKKILYSIILGAAALTATSCMEEDNFDPPYASIRGNLIDATTGKNYEGDQGDVHIRIWEKSWSDNPSYQDLNVKADGSYLNTKLFAGTYDMLPVDGSWWPCDTTYDVPIGNKNNATMDFRVTPYLKLTDFEVELIHNMEADMDTLVMSCKLFAPITDGLPQVRELRPFLSLNHFCGASNKLDYYYNDTYRINIRQAWSRIGNMDTGEGYNTYTINVPVKRGYDYWVRMGANVNDQYLKFNYTEIKHVQIPME